MTPPKETEIRHPKWDAPHKRRLIEMGFSPHSEQEYDPGRRLYVMDPDGIELELVEYAPAEVDRVRTAIAQRT